MGAADGPKYRRSPIEFRDTGFGKAQVEAHPTGGEGQRMRGGACLPAPALHLVGSLGIARCRDGVGGGVRCTPNPSFFSLDVLLTPSHHHPALLHLRDLPQIVIGRSALRPSPQVLALLPRNYLWIMLLSITATTRGPGSHHPLPGSLQLLPTAFPCLKFYPLPIHFLLIAN